MLLHIVNAYTAAQGRTKLLWVVAVVMALVVGSLPQDGFAQIINSNDLEAQVFMNSATTSADAGWGTPDFTVADGVIDKFRGVIDAMAATAATRALQLLFALFAIDLVITMGRGVMAGEELGAMMSRFVFRLGFVTIISIFIGYVGEFTTWVAQSAVVLGLEGAGSGDVVKPTMSGIFSQGWGFASAMLGEIHWSKPISIFYIVTAIFTLLITGVMMAFVLTVYAELYVVALAGMITLGFAGLETSKDSAVSYIKTLIGKGFKLIGLLIVFAMMSRITNEVAGATSYTLGVELLLTILILQIVTVILMSTIPSSLENLAGGIGATRAAEVVGGAVAAMVAGPVAKATMGAAMGGVGGGIAGGIKGGLSGGGVMKGAAGGAAKAAGRYGAAGLMPGRSISNQLGRDMQKLINTEKKD